MRPSVKRSAGFLSRSFRWLQRYGRWVLLTLGVAAVVGLVWSVGPAKLWATLLFSAPWLPAIMLCDVLWVAVEGIALLIFYGEDRRRIPLRAWLKALLTHYIVMVVLPVGRAGAEVTRAAMMSPHVGVPLATAGAAQMQAMVLFANTLICLPCLLVIGFAVGWSDGLTLLLLLNAVVTGLLGVGFYLVIRRAKVAGWLGKRFEKMAQFGPELDEVLRRNRRFPAQPLIICTAARGVQVLQYGLIVAAVGGVLTWESALISEGIHLVGAGLGDMVPNQVGVTEGAYRLFADALGLEDAPEKAVAIALVARISNLGVAALSFLALQLWPGAPPILRGSPDNGTR